jgi:hypothetical protein
MKISSCNIEFGYELIGVIPTAYFYHRLGLLKETESGIGSSPLYYFSPNHTEVKGKREFENKSLALSQDVKLPNVNIHRTWLDLSIFEPPPYKEHYKNDKYKYDRPTVCIFNRYNKEWGQPPINYFSLDCLDKIFKTLKPLYQIIYWGVDLPDSLQDQNNSMSLGDYQHIKNNHKDVIIFQDIVKDWNKDTMEIMANCERFITMNGGYSILASYFGGQNIIFSKKGHVETREIQLGSFERWYGEFGDSQICYVSDEEKLLKKINQLWVQNLPTMNILIRTANRPNYFRECISSIQRQDYPNINVIIGIEEGDKATMRYVSEYKYRVVFYKKDSEQPKPPSEDYGRWFPYNGFLDKMLSRVSSGYVMCLDDDDELCGNDTISSIMSQVGIDKTVYWRTKIGSRIIPKDLGEPKRCDITSNSFCHHISQSVKWDNFKRGDYRVSSQLWEKTEPIYIDKVLARCQDVANGGNRQDKKVQKNSNKVLCEILDRKFGEVGDVLYFDIDYADVLEVLKKVKKL